jgi:hypothetical protein
MKGAGQEMYRIELVKSFAYQFANFLADRIYVYNFQKLSPFKTWKHSAQNEAKFYSMPAQMIQNTIYLQTFKGYSGIKNLKFTIIF